MGEETQQESPIRKRNTLAGKGGGGHGICKVADAVFTPSLLRENGLLSEKVVQIGAKQTKRTRPRGGRRTGQEKRARGGGSQSSQQADLDANPRRHAPVWT